MDRGQALSFSGTPLNEIIRFTLPPGARVLPGSDPTGIRVGWVGWPVEGETGWAGVSPGDLAFVEASSGDRRVEAAVQAGAAAIVTNRQPAAAALASAAASGVAIVVLHAGGRLRDVERAVVTFLVNRQADLDRRGTQIYRHLAELVAADKGIGAVVVALHELTGRLVVLEHEGGGLRFHAGPLPGGVDRARLAAVLAEFPLEIPDQVLRQATTTAPPIRRRLLQPIGLAAWTAPIIVEDVIRGWISIVGAVGSLSEIDQIATGRAAAASALEVAKQQAVSAASGKLRSDLFSDLLTGTFATEDGAERRARALGHTVTLPGAVLVWRTRRGRGQIVDDQPVQSLELLLDDELRRLGGGYLVRSADERVVAYLPLGGVSPAVQTLEGARIWAQRVRARSPLCEQVSVGIGRPAQRIRDIQQSYDEAERALELALTGAAPDPVVAFPDLGVFRLLMPLRESGDLADFFEDTVGDLFELERRRTPRLLPTLRAFLNQNGNVSRTAEVLGIHRNTLLQRLERIEAVTGYQLDDPDARLALHVGLKAAALLDKQ